jgi:hypothetical protein
LFCSVLGGANRNVAGQLKEPAGGDRTANAAQG